ncbi:MAG: hypothetical protein ABFD92_21620 [Planctomycetaceae bacterium]
MFLKLLALLKAAIPLPVFTDAASFLAWWNGLGPSISEFVASLAKQIVTTGEAFISLPNGVTLSMTRGDDGVYRFDRSSVPMVCGALAEHDPEVFGKLGDGKLMEALLKFLELAEKILPLVLPLFLTPDVEPAK